MNDIVILSPDELFGRMLADECTFCGFPACVFPVADEHVSAARAVLIELDRIRPVPSPPRRPSVFPSIPTYSRRKLNPVAV